MGFLLYIFYSRKPKVFFQFFGAGRFVGRVVEISGPKTIFPTGNPFCSPAPKENPSSRACGKKRCVGREAGVSAETKQFFGRKITVCSAEQATSRMGMQCQSWSGITWVGRQTRCAMCRHYTNVFIPHGGSKVYHFLYFSSAPLQVDLMADPWDQPQDS